MEQSEVSNGKTNAKNVLKVKPSKLHVAIADLVDSNIMIFDAKGGKKIKNICLIVFYKNI